MPAYNWAGDVSWAGPVTWAIGPGEAVLIGPDIAWPEDPIGPSHTLLVPSFGGKSDLFRPMVFVGDIDVYAINFGPQCLDPMNDRAQDLLDCRASSPSLQVVTRTEVGQEVADGVVLVAVAGSALPGTYHVRVRISTVGGREISAVFSVTVLAWPP